MVDLGAPRHDSHAWVVYVKADKSRYCVVSAQTYFFARRAGASELSRGKSRVDIYGVEAVAVALQETPAQALDRVIGPGAKVRVRAAI